MWIAQHKKVDKWVAINCMFAWVIISTQSNVKHAQPARPEVISATCLRYCVKSQVIVMHAKVCRKNKRMFSCVLPCIDVRRGGRGRFRVSVRPLPTKGLSAATLTAAFSSEGAAALWTWARNPGVCVHQQTTHTHSWNIQFIISRPLYSLFLPQEI